MFRNRFSEFLTVSAYLWGVYLAPQALTQILPDSTLGSEDSIVTQDATIKLNQVVDLIEGGAARGNNLFHSFTEFNVAEPQQVYFASPPGITDIITRITGTNSSEIFGTLGVNGDANLLLLNPNGILFGQNSQLDIAGSFLGTTAESYTFDNGENFDTTNPNVPSLLTINFPSGLQFGANPGTIINRSQKPSIGTANPPAINLPEGLRISPDQKLSLLGGNISHEGGYLNTAGGNIELGAVGPDSLLELTPDGNSWQTSYDEVESYADIQLQQQAGIDGGNTGGTTIELRGKNISLGYSLESLVDIEVEDFFSLSALPSLNALPPDPNQIVAQNTAGNPAQVNIQAADSFSIIDPGLTQQNLLLNTFGSGDAGIININADNIILYGAGLESSTLAGASGNSGAINFQGNKMSLQNSFAAIETFSSGEGGTLNVDLDQDLKVKDGGFTAQVEDTGDGGTIQVSSERLEIVNGGFGSNTFGSGNGGVIELDIDQEIIVNSGGFGVDTFAEGDGGNITIETDNLEITNGGIGANNSGTGKGGEITVDTESISLFNSAINANSDSGNNPINAGQGGNIILDTENLLFSNSAVTTLGGTITIELDNVLRLLGSSENVVAVDDIDDIANMFNAEQTTALEDFIDDNQDKNIITGQLGTEVKTLTLENGGVISAGDNVQGLPGIALVAANALGFSNNPNPPNPPAPSNNSNNTSGAEPPSSPGAELFEFGAPPRVSQEAAPQPISTNQNIFVFRLTNGSNLVVNQRNLQAIIEAAAFSDLDNASDRAAKLVEILISSIAASRYSNDEGNSDDSKFDLSSVCRVDNSNFFSTGRGGVKENPLESVTPDFNIVDLGTNSNIDRPENHLTKTPSSQIFLPTDPIIEAKNWKVNREGNVELTVVAEQKNSNILIDVSKCLKSYFEPH